MSTLGFDNYVEPLKLYLQKYREAMKGEKQPGDGFEEIDEVISMKTILEEKLLIPKQNSSQILSRNSQILSKNSQISRKKVKFQAKLVKFRVKLVKFRVKLVKFQGKLVKFQAT